MFTGKWGSFEAEQEVKKQRKAERAVRKQQAEKVKVEKVEKVKVEEEEGDKTKQKKPSDLLRLWSHESPSKRGAGGKTVLGREADMLLMSWDQHQRVASYFTQPSSARKKEDRTSPSLELQRITEPLLEPQILVGLALCTFLPAAGQSSATLQQASKLVALLFPYYQTRMARCTRMVRGVFREEGLMVGGCLPVGTDLENRARKALVSQLPEVQRSLLHSELVPLLLLPAPRRPVLHLPHPSLAALGLALVSVAAISVDQLASLLRLLFPALRQDSQLEKCIQAVSFTLKPIRKSFQINSYFPDLNQISTFTNACIILHFQALVGNNTFLMEVVDGEKKYRLTNNSR